MDGDEATQRILKMYKNLKIGKNHRPYIVCVSAYEDDKHEEAARTAGMKGFLTKPVPQHLLKIVFEEAKANQMRPH